MSFRSQLRYKLTSKAQEVYGKTLQDDLKWIELEKRDSMESSNVNDPLIDRSALTDDAAKKTEQDDLFLPGSGVAVKLFEQWYVLCVMLRMLYHGNIWKDLVSDFCIYIIDFQSFHFICYFLLATYLLLG